MNTWEKIENDLCSIQEVLRYTFHDKKLIFLAFTHRSFVNEHRDLTHEHNERLEFLGDAVLGLIVSEYLYQEMPEVDEGTLSFARARLVDAIACACYMRKLQLGGYALIGRGEAQNTGKGRDTLFADLFEAIMGAIYLDGGFKAAKEFFFSHFLDELVKLLEEPMSNWKAKLQDYTQKAFRLQPVYKVIKEEGPEHEKLFEIAVFIEERELGKGLGKSKKDAEQEAARQALISEGQI